ncbi:archaemetzincin [Haloferula chungangensis]|uniref:Archaemetzincin n=1 Tax=Haloferula chungangensis TaxID=1048331 RepID=A0ABW2LE75_9BACT
MNWRLLTWMAPLGLLVSGWVLAFELPTASEREKAVGPVVGLDASMKRAFRNDGEYRAKLAPKPMDWLASHKEEGQSYQQWLDSRPNLPSGVRRKLYILPLGGFDGTAPDIKKIQRYAEAYFYPMKVGILPAAGDSQVKARSRVNSWSGKKQWNSRDILKWLPQELPNDAYAMLAVTMTDLYPDEQWNFVFGQASIRNRVGVFSFARYHPAWFGRVADENTESLVLRRAAKVLSHEMSHMFGIRHCIFYECNMNGANHLEEADSTPMHLCPVCLRKLQRATGCDPASRYGKLAIFYGVNGLSDEKEWVEKREGEIGAAR